MLITDKWYAPVLDSDKKYIFLLEHLEPAMEVEQLDRVITKHNEGIDYKLIAKQERRHPVEIILALIHQASTENINTPAVRGNRGTIEITRPFAKLLRGK